MLFSQNIRGGVLHVEDSIYLFDQGLEYVLHILRSKYPNATPARPEDLMKGNADPLPVHSVVYNQITASCKGSVAICVKMQKMLLPRRVGKWHSATYISAHLSL